MDAISTGCDCFAEPAYIQNGQLVNAETINPILRQLYLNDQATKAILDYFQVPSALLACVTINPSLQVGQPVFFSSQSGRYEAAGYATEVIGGSTYLSESAEVWGLVVRKQSSDTAYILVDGIHRVDLIAATGESVSSGRYYLGSSPGSLTATPADDVSPVYVCSATEDGWVLFRPHSGANAGLLSQWKYQLANTAAGTVTIADEQVTITAPDADLIGWLPADHVSFDGNAPAGAKFGYNLATDATLQERWPPRYLATIHLDLYRDSSASVGGTAVPLGADGLCIVDEHGIWWMSSCLDDTPFIADPPDAGEGCPRPLERHVMLYALKPNALIGGESHRFHSEHPSLQWRRHGTTQIADSGDLDLKLLPAALLDSQSDDGAYAVTAADDDSLLRTPVVSSLVAGPGITLAATHTTETDQKFGQVTIAASEFTHKELLPLTTALWKAEEERVEGTLGIGLPARQVSSITSAFQVPAYASGTFTAKFQFWSMAEFPQLTGTADPETLSLLVKVLPPPPPAGVSLSSLTELTPAMPETLQTHRLVTVTDSAEFSLPPGSTVYVTLEREADSSVHSLHILRHGIQLTGFEV